MLTQLQLLENSGVLLLSNDFQKVITNPQAFIKKIHFDVLDQKLIFLKKGKLSTEEWISINDGENSELIENFMLRQKTMFFDEYSKEFIFPNYLSLYDEDEDRFFLTISEEFIAFSIQF